MRLSELIRDVDGARLHGADVEVRGVTEDSRRIGPGDVFVAVRGRTVDGHDYARGAVERGAAALVVEALLPIDAPQVVVASTLRSLGVLVARALGDPADRMRLIGVTGTNGKTTTTYLVEAMLAAAGRRPGVVGTVNARYAGREIPASFTTPLPGELHGALAAMADAGTTDVVMETTSSALALERLTGLTFAVAAFSNLTQDHLDVHGTMEAYRDAKARLFSERLARDGAAVVNVDDPAGEGMLAAAPPSARKLRVSTRGAGDVSVTRATSTVAGIEATFATPRGPVIVKTAALFGDYNIANLALAVGIAEALGLPHEAVVAGIAGLRGVPGRVERVANDRGLDVFVDYAHTPDALERVIAALRPLTAGRLIVVFGCGGDRDPTKRPKMGAIVARDADVAVVTSDNPRTEEPRAIVDMILAGMGGARAETVVEVDRRAAIGAAVRAAGPGDVVLIAGKGHEDYQILGKTKIHFDDREEAQAAILARFTVDDVLAATGGTLLRDGARAFGGVSIDGRSARRGDLYVAVRGERFDGHDFCAQAVAAGAWGLLVERAVEADATQIRVADSRDALGAIAREHRRRWGGRVVGVTGSTGKTTTKQLIAAMLAGVAGERGVLATEGSLNNETGVPMTLLRLRPEHRFAVIEMGMRGLGQIDALASFAEPEVAVVVNVGVTHIGVVGSIDGIADAKSEIWRRGAQVAIYPHGDARLTARAGTTAARPITFGEDPGATVRVVSVEPRGVAGSRVTLQVAGREAPLVVDVPLVGRHNAGNAACAIAVGLALGIDLDAGAAGIAQAKPGKQRGELAEIAGRHVIVDCYNANPASMRAALDTLAGLAGGQPAVAVLGDMLELGATEDDEHQAIGREVKARGVERLITLGERAREIARAARAAGVAQVQVVNVDDIPGAAQLAASWAGPGGWILVKASRGMRLERVVEALRELPPEIAE